MTSILRKPSQEGQTNSSKLSTVRGALHVSGAMRIELRELQHRLGVTSLYVTHDLEEALAMSDRIVVMRAEHIEQIGTPDEIYDYPRTDFVADFVGSSNLITGRLRPDLSCDGLVAVETPGGQILHGVAHGRTPGPEPTMSVRTVHLHLHQERPAGDRNIWPATVRRAVFLGDLTQVHVIWGERELVVRHTKLALREGEGAFLSADPSQCVLLEPSGPESAG